MDYMELWSRCWCLNKVANCKVNKVESSNFNKTGKFSRDFDHRNKITTMQNVLDDSYFCRTLLGG